MSFYPVALSQVLAKISKTAPVEIKETTPGLPSGGHRLWKPGEWFLLGPDSDDDHNLWQALTRSWPVIVGLHGKDFALIHCRHDPYKGVWLHHLPTDEYAPGCHQIADWSGPGDEGPEERNSGKGRAAF
jgi:hypothetical protein